MDKRCVICRLKKSFRRQVEDLNELRRAGCTLLNDTILMTPSSGWLVHRPSFSCRTHKSEVGVTPLERTVSSIKDTCHGQPHIACKSFRQTNAEYVSSPQ